MDLEDVSMSRPGAKLQQKAAALRDAVGVTRLVELYCTGDPAWCLALLESAAPTLEQLGVWDLDEAHLRVVHAMPRLRRLDIWSIVGLLDAQPPVLPALSQGHTGLQWLRVKGLPRATTLSLLRAHSHSLEDLQLVVGTTFDGEWPQSGCSDLHSLLQQCGLRVLRRLVMWYANPDVTHEAAPCRQQRGRMRRVLPGAKVLCNVCDRLPGDPF